MNDTSIDLLLTEPAARRAARPSAHRAAHADVRPAARLALIAALLLAPALRAEAASYSVSIDTRSIAGLSGSVDLQWNVAATDAGLVAGISGFAGPSLVGAAVLLPPGDVSGSFAAGSALAFGGGQLFTYIYQPVTFGSSVAFRLTLPDQGPVLPGVTGGSVFSVSVLDLNALPLLPADADSGASLRFDLASASAPVVTAYGPVTVGAITAAVPEPSTWALLLIGLAGCGVAAGALRRERV